MNTSRTFLSLVFILALIGCAPPTPRPEMSRYLIIIIEETGTGFSAYSPDLPGCVATGRTRAEVETEMHDAIEFHIEGLRLSDCPVPEPRSRAASCEVAA